MGSIPPQEIVPDKISNLVRRQFPDWYLEHGQTFVDFLQAYYQYLETPNNPLYYSRKYYEIKDIDFTLNEFIIHFKEKYLKNIQLSTQANTAQIIKHCLDIYRSKGTPRCVSLLFQLVFNQQPKFYYPSTDLFKLSDGEWFKPQYLELLLSDNNIAIVGKQIKGITSGATAFVEDVIRRYTVNRLEDVAYISAVQGAFKVWEKITITDGSITIQNSPTIIGSLTAIQIPVNGLGQGFSCGDVITLSSLNGNGAVAVVTDTVTNFGIVSATVEDGGYGYTNTNIVNNAIYISNAMFTISNLQIVNTGLIQYFSEFDSFVQPQIYLNYTNSTGPFSPGDSVFTYFANGSTKGQGTVIQTNQTTANAGTLLVGIVSGNIAFDPFFNLGNTSAANLQVVNSFMQSNATGKFMANDTFISVVANNIVNESGFFTINEQIYQPSCVGAIQIVQPNSNGTTTFQITNIEGVFNPNYTFTGLSSGATAAPIAVSIGVGLSNVSPTLFSSFANNTVYCYANDSYANLKMQGTISKVEQGSGFLLGIANTLLYPETVLLNTDLVANYLTTNINAASYGLPANTSANLTSIVVNALTYVNATIGKISSAFVTNPGNNYTKPPFVALDYPIRALQYHDLLFQISGATSSFQSGDIVTQAATKARGMIKTINTEPDETTNTTQLYIQNMRFYQNNWFVPTTNSTTIIVSSSGPTANIVSISSDDDDIAVMGYNFDLETTFTIGAGAIANIVIQDSGFGFVNNESVFVNGNSSVNATAILLNQGVGAGRYRKKGGFLSDQKKLFDGFFYQNYSYQIISSLTLDRYQQMLNEVTHPAGTIMFGQLQYNNVGNNAADVQHAGFYKFNVYPQAVSSIINANTFAPVTYFGHGKTLNLTLTDSISLTKPVGRGKIVSTALLDAVSKANTQITKFTTITINDNITTLKAPNKKMLTTLTDNITVNKGITRPVIAVTLHDTLVVAPGAGRAKPITVSLTDHITLTTLKGLGGQKVISVTLTDTITKTFSNTKSQGLFITLTDSISRVNTNINKTVPIIITDNITAIKFVNKAMSSITLTDTIAGGGRGRFKSLAVTLTDHISLPNKAINKTTQINLPTSNILGSTFQIFKTVNKIAKITLKIQGQNAILYDGISSMAIGAEVIPDSQQNWGVGFSKSVNKFANITMHITVTRS